MSSAEEQLREDRALRNAARANFLADIEHVKETFSAKGVASRIGGRIGDGAKDVIEVAKVQADDNRGIIAILIGAIALWLAREPIFEVLGLELPEEDTTFDSAGSSAIEDPETPASQETDTAASPIPGDENEQ